MFYQDLFNWCLAWGRTRRWRRLMLWALIPLLLLTITVGLVVWGATLSRQQLASRYLELVNESVEANLREVQRPQQAEQSKQAGADAGQSADGSGADGSSDAQAQVSPAVFVSLRRIMQLGNSNERVRYLVGWELAKQGRMGMSAQLLREIAPEGGGGFPAAHAILANYSLAAFDGTEAQAESLLADFAAAEQGGIRLDQQQLRIFAKLLLGFGRKQQAVNVLADHADDYPELHADVVHIMQNQGNEARTALAAFRENFKQKRKSASVTFADVQIAVGLEVLDGEVEKALELAEFGRQLTGSSAESLRLLSQVLIVKHRGVMEQYEAEVGRAKALGNPPPPLDLQYLELAGQLDSANPLVSEELAKVTAMGQDLSAELKTALEQSLVDGSASGVTHLILANRKLADDDPAEALPQLRMALRKMPNSPIVLNNLAYSIMKYEPENLAEARELIERALRLPGASPANLASMCDTLAEIRQASGDTLGAIEAYEQAIKHDGSKLNTRRKLAEAYAQAGMQDLAKGQLAKVEELQAEKK